MSSRDQDSHAGVNDRCSDESRPAILAARTLSWPSGDLSVHEFGALAILATDGPQTAATDHEDLTILSTAGRRIVEHLLAHRRREIEIVMAYAIGDDATAIAAALERSACEAGEHSQIDAEQLLGTRHPKQVKPRKVVVS